ncbi:MAG: hypothetical protein AAB971_03315, partial [Patescibacteria group bacterium]
MVEVSGRGLKAALRGHEVLIGRLSLLQEHGINLPAKFKPGSINQTAVYVALGGELVGVITFGDEARPEAAATLEQLH